MQGCRAVVAHHMEQVYVLSEYERTRAETQLDRSLSSA